MQQKSEIAKKPDILREITERKTRFLTLQDGTTFQGFSFGAEEPTEGETVFSTSMVGYPEALTDPSYRGQILCLTYPLVGNYGVPSYEVAPHELPAFFESDCIQVRGLVVHEICKSPSHWQSIRSLDEWFRTEKIPGIYGVDTRRLARVLREKGVMLGRIGADDVDRESNKKIDDPNKLDLVGQVSVHEPVTYCEGRPNRIALIDCGVKNSIIRNLLKRNLTVVRMPHDAKASEILNIEPAGVVVSNGPGNPKTCTSTINTIQELIGCDMPTLGICLGTQLIALAEGADTYKMKYGHRSQNQPVIDVDTGRCYITTQNHGYAVDKAQLENAGLEVWFVNANDRSIEGIRHPKKPFWGVQWHPEASPGPTDTEFIFDFFVNKVIHDASS
jgi:carbamoyl-phosphate synthase small subunit